MHSLEGPEVERQVLDTVRTAVVKVHARGYLGPRAACQGPGPDRAPGAASPSHPGSTPDRSPGPRDSQPPPWAARRDYISRRAPGRRRSTSGWRHTLVLQRFRTSLKLTEAQLAGAAPGTEVVGKLPTECRHGIPNPVRLHFPDACPATRRPESGRCSRHALSARGSAGIVRRSRGPWWTVPSSQRPPLPAAYSSPSSLGPQPETAASTFLVLIG